MIRAAHRRIPILLAALCAFACGPGSPGGFEPDADAVAANNRGVGLMGSFDYAGAREVFAELAERHPRWLDVRVNQAIATLNRQQEGDEAEALRLLEAVLAEDPDHLRAHYCAGLLRLYLGEAEAAARHFRHVAEADPDDAYAAYYLGQSLAELGRREEALDWTLRAVRADPYLRSAVFAAARTLQALGRPEEAERYFADYQRLEGNPQARLAEFKYTRMGPRGAVRAFDAAPAAPAPPPPAGAVFAAAERLPFAAPDAAPAAGLTAVDLGDAGGPALFAPGARSGPAANLLLRPAPDGAWQADAAHPLAGVSDVRAAAWGDWDNDGLVDAYLLRRGPNQLWRQESPGRWRDVTAETGTAAGDLDSVDGGFLDADHDGDLDLFVVHADGANELLNNDRDGRFRPLAAEYGLGGGDRPSRAFLPADLDADRDLDLVVIHAEPPHEVFANDRLWQYRPAPGFAELEQASIAAAVAGDADADGRVELYTVDAAGALSRWRPDDTGVWRPRLLARVPPSPSPQLALQDVTGSGRLALLHSAGDGIAARSLHEPSEALWQAEGPGALAAWTPVVRDAARGPALAARSEGGLVWFAPGPGRHPFAAFAFSGREDVAQSMRSNASGLGTRASVRVGSRWTVAHLLRNHSGPGQSLQPLAVGLGGAPRLDFVAIDWSDGVFQSELDLAPGLHRVAETQRQLSSCPILFAWDGASWAFVSDVLGVGGIGQAVGPGAYAPSRPREHFLLPAGLPAARDGRHRLQIAQMMEEVVYLDAARLVAYDLPPGWQIVLDERMAGGGPAPTGAPRFFRRERLPVRARNDRGEDVRGALARADGRAAPPGDLDARFLGLLAGEHVLTLDFGAPLAGPGRPLLVLDGWVEYPYSQTAFAAWQAGRRYRSLTLEARAGDGPWRPLWPELGYPAGMPRRMSMPLDGLPDDTTALRLRTNQQIYVDRVAVAWAEPLAVARNALPLVAARLERPGFARRVDGPQRRPGYDFASRVPFWDTRHPTGFYTRFGPAAELVAATDDALAVFGPGEAVVLEFDASGAPAPAPGALRRHVLEADGWAKDMDLYTRDGGRVEPLPSNGHAPDVRRRLHARYNTRYQSGR